MYLSFLLLALKIISDANSDTNGYYPLKIEVIAGVKLLTGDYITIGIINLNDSQENCIDYITDTSNIKDIECVYRDKLMRIKIHSFAEDLFELEGYMKIIIGIDNVKYNTKMTPQELTVSLQDSEQYTIASTTDRNSWIPSKPASLKEFTFNFFNDQNIYTYDTNALVFSAQLSNPIDKGQLISIQIFGTDSNIQQDFQCKELTIIQKSATIIKGLTACKFETTLTVIIYHFNTPINEKPFYVTLTVYAGAEEVASEVSYKQDSASINACKAVVKGLRKMKVLSGNFVSETGIHELTLTIPFGITRASQLHYNLPEVYDVTNVCEGLNNCQVKSTHEFITTNLATVTNNADGTTTLKFSVINPPTNKPMTEEFNVVVYKESYPSFLIVATLDGYQTYSVGQLRNFNVDASKALYDATTYTLSFVTVHKVLKGSSIAIEFPTDIITTKATLQSITIDQNIISSAQLKDLIITDAFLNDLTSSTSIQIKLDNIQNPIFPKTYSSFSIFIQHEGYTSDMITGGSITTSSPGTVPGSCSLGNVVNSATTNYTFTIKSTYPLPNSAEFPEKQLYLSKPSSVPYCNFEDITAVNPQTTITYISGNDSVIYSIQYPSDASELAFKLSCTNPPTTQPTAFTASIYLNMDGKNFKCVGSEMIVATEKGQLLEVLLPIQNSPTFPAYTTMSELTIERTDLTIPIHKVIISIPYALIPAPYPACKIDLNIQYSCTLINGNEINILFNSAWTSSTLKISDMYSVNPHNNEQSLSVFSVTTHTKVGSVFYIVDQAEDAGKLYVSCTYPCKECLDTDPTLCLSCVNNNPQKIFYLVREEYACKEDSENVCGTGFYKNKETFTCDQCVEECKECTNTASYCLECSDESKLVMNGVCQDSCDNGYYNPPDSKVCSKCQVQCEMCKNAANTCLSCSSGYYLLESACLAKCPEQMYEVESSRTCEFCDLDKCYSCSQSASNCTSCYEDKLLEVDTYRCVSSCRRNYYISGPTCIKCSDSCPTCSGASDYCTSCAFNLFLYENKCLISCPATTYALGTICKPCGVNCYTCQFEESYCTSCSLDKVQDGSTCLDECPTGKFVSDGICMECASQCQTCVGNSAFCTSCSNPENYLYLNTCHNNCPTRTIKTNKDGIKQCVECSLGCLECLWKNEREQKCTKCEEGLKFIDNGCIYSCPKRYELSKDETTCKYVGLDTNYIPFPFFIAAVVFLILPLVGWIRNFKSFFFANLMIGCSILLLLAFIVQLVFSIINDKYVILWGTVVSIITNIVLNLLFYFPYKKHVLSDTGFIKWQSLNSSVGRVISILSYVLSFQVRRLYYSRFIGIEQFYVKFTNIKGFISSINLFSLGYILFTLLPISIINIYGFLSVNWGGQLYVTIIETFSMSVVMTMIILYAVKTSKVLTEPSEDSDYTTLNATDNNTRVKELEEVRQEILKQVMTEINMRQARRMFKKNKPIRIQTLPSIPCEDKEKDKREILSFPCTPKTR